MNPPHPFTREYYEEGPDHGLSNYRSFRWLPEASIPCAARMMKYLGAKFGDRVHEVGCAKGFIVKALRILGFDATGNDISNYAIENCDPEVKPFVHCGFSPIMAQWIVAKDVAEHVQPSELPSFIDAIVHSMKQGALLIVPLGDSSTGEFRTPQDNADSTHVICWSMAEWLAFIQARMNLIPRDLVVQGAYHLPGVKQACDPYPESVAFLTIRQL